jgi:hypothetical protein
VGDGRVRPAGPSARWIGAANSGAATISLPDRHRDRGYGMIDERKTVRVQGTVRVHVLMTPSEVKAIDDWSSERRVRGRSEAIRHLVALGLKAAEDGGDGHLGEAGRR